MSRRHLRRLIWCTVLGLAAFSLLLLAVHRCASDWAEPARSLVPFALGVPAAILAGAFQRRTSYLQALRDYWKQAIPAVQASIQYTHLTTPNVTVYAKVMEGLSTTIDLTRGVFANVSSTRKHAGLYPFENLKDIQLIISWLGYGDRHKSGHADQVRACITRLWQETHSALLAEFDRDVPVRPVSKYLHSGRSIADLLMDGTLSREHLLSGISASNPQPSPGHPTGEAGTPAS